LFLYNVGFLVFIDKIQEKVKPGTSRTGSLLAIMVGGQISKRIGGTSLFLGQWILVGVQLQHLQKHGHTPRGHDKSDNKSL
jgi:hypothetical protein